MSREGDDGRGRVAAWRGGVVVLFGWRVACAVACGEGESRLVQVAWDGAFVPEREGEGERERERERERENRTRRSSQRKVVSLLA